MGRFQHAAGRRLGARRRGPERRPARRSSRGPRLSLGLVRARHGGGRAGRDHVGEPARVGVRRPRGPGRRRRPGADLPDAVGRPGRATSSTDSAAAIAIVSTRAQLDKVQEVRHQLPALQAVVVMDAAAAEASPPSVFSLADVARARSRAAADGVGRRQGVPRRGARRPARAARDDHLHLRHDRRAEGRDADPRRAGVEPARPPPACCDVSRERRRLVVPAAQPRLRADGRPGSTCYCGVHDRLRRIVRHHRPRHRRWCGRPC